MFTYTIAKTNQDKCLGKCILANWLKWTKTRSARSPNNEKGTHGNQQKRLIIVKNTVGLLYNFIKTLFRYQGLKLN